MYKNNQYPFMKITLAKSAGFCFGVKRALDIVLKTIQSDNKVYLLGNIVHNEIVVRQLRKSGVKIIRCLMQGAGKTLVIRAHGASKATLRKAKRLGYKIIDATCPMVKEIHKIATQMEEKDYRIIVIGDKKHDEVCSIIGQLKHKAIVIDDYKNIPSKVFEKIKKATVVVQSTQNIEKVLKIVAILKSQIKELKFFNTICNPTRKKQAEIKEMSRENDIMIIVGSKRSANTKRLYEISQSINRKTFWIQSKKNLQKEWFKDIKRIGITAGASTPETTTKEIIRHIKYLTVH